MDQQIRLISHTDELQESDVEPRLDPGVFWVALLLVVGVTVPLVLYPEGGLLLMRGVLDYVTRELGAVFLWFGLGTLVFLAWLAASRLGRVRLGSDTDGPAYSDLSWFGMLFSAGMGSNLLYFGTTEWTGYYAVPPFGVEALSAEAAVWSGAYSFFHWGLTGWGMYALAALPIGYAIHVRKARVLRLSEACRGILGDLCDTWVGTLVDVVFILGLVGGMATSLGIGVPMVSAVAGRLLGIAPGFALDVSILVALTIVFCVSVALGIDKGIKRLSGFNLALAAAFLLFVLVAGPTAFILNMGTESLGLMGQNFLRMSLHTDPVTASGFPQASTIFYWAWWVAWAPFMGLFVARISGGRSIRNVIVGVVLGGSAGCWLGFAILGNTALSLELGSPDTLRWIAENQGASQAVVALLESLPFRQGVMGLFLVLSFIFVATSVDSAAFTLAATASKDLEADGQPARWHRLLWALVLGGFAMLLMYLGGLEVLQATAVVVGLPVLVVLVISTASLMRWIRDPSNTLSRS